ncbi:hydroxyacylglutathione hydrolase [Orbus hercynius]|uniref:Hydroxyacylglutathione hydrolase n=1 Tax=Orbus hercynius TaxID=593135 RepID=A0A495RJN7_9GAMM|nr:hydroxyacylglutathione hydrolase [Orbus hercynius]RKS87753.1 hydroxyacylglutathione hydrolase [Orbus hercynius]
MTKYKLHIIPSLTDNYIWLLENSQHQVIIVDPGEASPVIDYLSTHHLSPIAILLTHHHHDHVDGVGSLQQRYPNLPAFGPDEIDLPITKISPDTSINFGELTFEIIPVPGHTLGHVAYYAKPYLFCGDTLFSAGCGRLFEGTHAQMLTSLNRLKALPNDTIVCAAHEYTLSNLKFAATLVPEDMIITQYEQHIKHQAITLPSTIVQEKDINLFLRCDEVNLQKKFNFHNELELFKFFRTQKDSF